MRDRTPAWLWATIVAGYAGLVVLMLAPQSNYAAFGSAIASGDPKLLAWTFAWTSHAILTGAPLFDANVFYPARPALAFAEHHIGVGMWGLPLFALTGNPVLVYSTLKIVALTLNAIAMHVFVRRWLGSHVPALVAGLVFGVSSTRLIYGGHVPLVWNCWMPMILIAADRWGERREWRWMVATALLVVMQALAGWYLAIMAGLALGLFVAWRALWARAWMREMNSGHNWRLTLAQAAAGVLIAGVILWPFARPYLALAGHAEVSPEAARLYAADAGTYLQPPEAGLTSALVTRLTQWPARPGGYERVQFMGLLTLLLALVGTTRVLFLAAARAGRRDHAGEVLWGGYFLLLGVVAMALSTGPSVDGEFPRLFDAISRVPVLGMFRVPARFAVLVTLAVAGLSALGVAQFLKPGRLAGRIGAAVLIPLLLAEWAIVPPAASRPQPRVTPPIYGLIPTLDVHAMVSLPSYRRTGRTWPMDADYMLYSTTHWRPIVNGYGKSEPPGYHWAVGAVDAFPGPNSATRMRELGINVVVLHTARYADPERAAEILAEARTSPDFELVSQMGDDYLFRLRPPR